MSKRVIKQTKIQYKTDDVVEQRDRSRDKHQQTQLKTNVQSDNKPKSNIENNGDKDKSTIVKIDSSRRAQILAMRKQMRQSQQMLVKKEGEILQDNNNRNEIKVVINNQGNVNRSTQLIQQKSIITEFNNRNQQEKISKIQPNQQQQQQEQQNINSKILLKPVYMDRTYRTQVQSQNNGETSEQHLKQQQRKKKAIRYTTKMLLQDNIIREKEEQEIDSDDAKQSDDDGNQATLPSDNDNVNQQYQYQLWKIRELKRIRRDKQQRQKAIIEKAELQRRRQMNNQQIMLENKRLGSDVTDNMTETKYVFMQKYYHRGAFYQDSVDPIFKRDYNLPTPLQMQDKSILPQLLQKRKGNFGTKGQSKYTHLNNEDTTNFDPKTRADESILQNWKKKTGGYKMNNHRNI